MTRILPLFVVAELVVIPVYAQTGSIGGQLIDEEGKPMAGIVISIDRVGIKQHFQIKSDIKGSYVHAGLPTGRYKVSFIKDGKAVTLGARVTLDGLVTVDFDLRLMTPSALYEKHRVTAAGLAVPRKAQEEFRRAFEAKDNVEKAKKHLEKAIEIAPDFEDALNNLGTIYYRKQQYAEAAKLFERALKVNPDSFSARVNLGGTLLSLGQYGRAVIENMRAVTIRPKDALAQLQTGSSLFYLKRYDEAIPYLRNAKETDPYSPTLPGLFLASAYDAMGNGEAAIAEYEEFLKVHPASEAADEIQSRLRELKLKRR